MRRSAWGVGIGALVGCVEPGEVPEPAVPEAPTVDVPDAPWARRLSGNPFTTNSSSESPKIYGDKLRLSVW